MSAARGRARGAVAALGALALLATAGPAAGQPAQSGGLRPAQPSAQTTSQFMGAFSSSVTVLPEREALEAEADAARNRLGPLKLRPLLSVGNFGYTNNFFGESDTQRQDDFTATATGGVKAIVPIGSRVFLRGSVLPSYTWYSKHTERRTFGGTYDAAALFYLSRLSLQLSGGSYDSTLALSSEVEQPVRQKVLSGRAVAQWAFGSRMSLVGDVSLARRRLGGTGLTDADLATLSRLDGTDSVWSVGVRRKVGSRLVLGASYERGALSFVNEGTLRDATTEGVLGSAYLDRSRLELNVYAGYRKLRPAAGSSIVEHGGVSGGASLSYALGRIVSLGVFGRSGLVSSVQPDASMYDERRAGATIAFSPHLLSLAVSAEAGTNDYLAPAAGAGGTAAKRSDDVRTLRGTIRGRVSRFLTLGVEASESRYTSNLPGNDRSIFRVGTTIGIGPTGSIAILD